ncbi:MAG: hypothetical protein KDD11_18990 [Acidobacteria bacterium]|nr:hypothetical protein [Acidobacteriota bacterium]
MELTEFTLRVFIYGLAALFSGNEVSDPMQVLLAPSCDHGCDKHYSFLASKSECTNSAGQCYIVEDSLSSDTHSAEATSNSDYKLVWEPLTNLDISFEVLSVTKPASPSQTTKGGTEATSQIKAPNLHISTLTGNADSSRPEPEPDNISDSRWILNVSSHLQRIQNPETAALSRLTLEGGTVKTCSLSYNKYSADKKFRAAQFSLALLDEGVTVSQQMADSAVWETRVKGNALRVTSTALRGSTHRNGTGEQNYGTERTVILTPQSIGNNYYIDIIFANAAPRFEPQDACYRKHANRESRHFAHYYQFFKSPNRYSVPNTSFWSRLFAPGGFPACHMTDGNELPPLSDLFNLGPIGGDNPSDLQACVIIQ